MMAVQCEYDSESEQWIPLDGQLDDGKAVIVSSAGEGAGQPQGNATATLGRILFNLYGEIPLDTCHSDAREIVKQLAAKGFEICKKG